MQLIRVAVVLFLAVFLKCQPQSTSEQIPRGRFLPMPVLDAFPRATRAATARIAGTAGGGARSVQISSQQGLVVAPVTPSGGFEVDLKLRPNSVNRIYVQSADLPGIRPGGGGVLSTSAPAAAIITQDSQAPKIFIDFPEPGATIETLFSPGNPTVDVVGRVADRLTGFMGLKVKVNDQEAEVDAGIGTNGTFFLPNLRLNRDGSTQIEVRAIDGLGNMEIEQQKVMHETIPAGTPFMVALSGNGQSGSRGSELPQPIRIRVFGPGGADLAGKIVTFHVERSDGRLSAAAGGSGSMTLQAFTDDEGEAQAYWTLGSDAGCGNNRVSVTSRDIRGTVLFCASGQAGPATMIAIGSGNNQRGETSTPAVQPLKVYVHDGQNGIASIPVVFSILSGGGLVAGQPMATTLTDATGHAEVEFTFGPLVGIQEIQATFPTNPGMAAVFTNYGFERSDEQTSFFGIVVDNANQPVQGARVELDIAHSGALVTETDLLGQFKFPGLGVAGPAVLVVDGGTAFHVGGPEGQDIPLHSFPGLDFEALVIAQVENSLPMPIVLPPLDPLNFFTYTVNSDEDLEMTIRTLDETGTPVEVIEGLKFTLDKDTRITLADGRIVGPGAGNLSSIDIRFNQVFYDKIPMAMPDGAAPPFAWTLKPPGASFDPPIGIEMPNMAGLSPGAGMYFLSFDHDSGSFEIVASGKVSEDGSMMESDEGSGITISGWGGFCPPYPDSGDTGDDGDDPPDDNMEPDDPKPTQDTPPITTEGNPYQCEESPADPIYFFSGEFYEEVTDVEIKGRGLNFLWARKYRSKDPVSSRQGNNWDCSYNIFIEELIRPLGQPSFLRLCDGNGRADTYKPRTDGTWRKEGFFREFIQNPDQTFSLIFADRSRWNFNLTDPVTHIGKIASIVDRNGNTIAFTYDGQGRLVTVHDTLDTASHDRDITIAYNAEGFVESITDFAGRQVRYEYYLGGEDIDGDLIPDGSAGDLKSVRTPIVVGTPNGNDFPLGKTTFYTYSTGFMGVVAERLNHNLLTIRDGRGNVYLRNEYSPTMAPAALNFDRIVRQAWGNADDLIDLVYVAESPGEENGFAAIRTILNDRVGNVTEYFFDQFNRCTIERAYTGRADPDQPTTLTENRPTGKLRSTDPDFFDTRHEWNRNYQRTCTIEPDGSETFTLYEGDLDRNAPQRTKGNPRVRVRLAGDRDAQSEQGRIVETFEYESGFAAGCCGSNFVTKHIDGRGNVTTHEYDAFGNKIRTVDRIPSIVEEFEYNQFGQMTLHRLPDNGSGHRREDVTTYYTSGPQAGYVKDQIVDDIGFAITTTYEYDAVGNVVRRIDPRGNDTLYAVNALDQVVRETSRQVETSPGSGTFVRYHTDYFFDGNDNLVRTDVLNVADNGVTVAANPYLTTLHEYEVLDQVVRTCRESGSHDVQRSPPQLDCAGLPASEFVTMEYQYDANRNQTKVIYGEAAEGRQPTNTLSTRYDERNLVFKVIRAEGDPDQSTSQYDYDLNQNLVRTLAGLEDQPRTTSYRYDGYDRLVRTTDPMGNVERRKYDENGNLASLIKEGALIDQPGSSGNVRLAQTDYVYDAMDRLIRQEIHFFERETGTPIHGGQQLGRAITSYAHSDNSQIVQVVNDNLHSTLTTYDTANRVAVVTDAKGNSITNAYDANSNFVSVLETEKPDLGGPDELFTTTHAYDHLDRRVMTTDNAGNTTGYHYDSRGNTTRTIDALDHEVSYVHDSLDRLVATHYDMDDDGADGDGPDIATLQSWDDTNRLTAQIDDNGHRVRYAYDELDRLIVTQMADGTLSQVGTGAIWPIGNNTPNLLPFSSGYDVHDNATTTLDANGSAAHSSYDLLDRATSREIIPGSGVDPDTTMEAFSYDGDSALVRASDNDSNVEQIYDSIGNVLRDTLTIGAASPGATRNTYDGVGNMVRCMYPSGRLITYSFDQLERRKTVTDETNPESPVTLAVYEYSGTTRVAQRDYGNNTRCSYAYDGITGLPNVVGDFGVKSVVETSHVTDPEGTTTVIDLHRYTWDPVYNKKSRSDDRLGGPGLRHEYSYDPTYRLEETIVRDGTSTIVESRGYALDGVGNRTSVVGTPHPGSYTCDDTLPAPADCQMNQYTNTPLDVREYDDNGNLVLVDMNGLAERTIIYDYRNRPVLYTDDAGSASYKYDALGRRIERTIAGQTTSTMRYFYCDWRVCEEQDASGSVLATYTYGLYIDEIIEMQRGGQSFYYHADDQYNITAITDGAGAVIERYAYQDYGLPSIFDEANNPRPTSAVGNTMFFNGRPFDGESGYYFYRTRYLDPSVGRFISQDFLGAWRDESNFGNAFTFTSNNPATLVDPFGDVAFPYWLIPQIIKQAGKKAIEWFVRTWIGRCNAIYVSYKAACAIPCRPGQPCSYYAVALPARTACASGRALYIRWKCDIILPTKANHALAAAEAAKSVVNCTVHAANCCP